MIELPATLTFDGSVILITGAARGLGRSYARLCAARGARLVVNDLWRVAEGADASTSAEDFVAALNELGGAAFAVDADINTPRGATAAVAAALKQFGRLDGVINNAGVVRAAPFVDTTLADLETMLASHVRGTFLVARAAWPTMAAQGHGRIVATSSSAGLYGQAGLSAYAAAKGAIIGLVKTLGLEGADLGIRTNAVAPLGHTRLNADLPDLERRALFERHFSPDLVAPLVALLAHPACPTNGEVFSAGGGRFARAFIAEGAGYLDLAPSMESVRDNFGAAMSDRDFVAPASASDTFARTVELIAGGR